MGARKREKSKRPNSGTKTKTKYLTYYEIKHIIGFGTTDSESGVCGGVSIGIGLGFMAFYPKSLLIILESHVVHKKKHFPIPYPVSLFTWLI